LMDAEVGAEPANRANIAGGPLQEQTPTTERCLHHATGDTRIISAQSPIARPSGGRVAAVVDECGDHLAVVVVNARNRHGRIHGSVPVVAGGDLAVTESNPTVHADAALAYARADMAGPQRAIRLVNGTRHQA